MFVNLNEFVFIWIMSQPCNTEDCVWYVLKKQEEDNYWICIETKRKQVEDVVVRERRGSTLDWVSPSYDLESRTIDIELTSSTMTEHLSSAHFGDVSVGTKFPNQKSHKKTNCQKNMHLLKNSNLLRCRILGRVWLTKDLIEVIIYSPFITMYLNFFTSIKLLFGSKDGQSLSDVPSSFIMALLCWLLKRTLDLQNSPSLSSHQNCNYKNVTQGVVRKTF